MPEYDCESLFASLIHSLLARGSDAVVDATFGAVLTLLSVFVIPRQLWRLRGAHHLSELKILISEREPELTRTYALPVVGLGQVQAIGALAPSLVRAYGWRWRGPLQIRPGLNTVEVPELTGNLIVLGGASRNAVTRRLLDKRQDVLGVRQEHGSSHVGGDRLFLRERDGSWRSYGGMPVDGTIRQVIEDYSLCGCPIRGMKTVASSASSLLVSTPMAPLRLRDIS
jgi:hypothetical protein